MGGHFSNRHKDKSRLVRHDSNADIIECARFDPVNIIVGMTIAQANRVARRNTSSPGAARSAFVVNGKSSGKWYIEFHMLLPSSSGAAVGIAPYGFVNDYIGRVAGTYAYYTNGNKFNNNTFTAYGAAWGSGFGTGDTIGMALDMDAGKLFFRKESPWTGDPVAGTGVVFTGLTGTFYAGASVFAADDRVHLIAPRWDIPAGYTLWT